MANNQNRFLFASSLLQIAVTIFGTNRTGLTGPEKKQALVDGIEPLINAGVQQAENNTGDAMTKLEIGVGVQLLHDTLLRAGLIHDTAALEAGTAPIQAAAPVVNITTAASPAPTAAPSLPPPASQPAIEQAKYQQWLRLPNPGTMPTNETLKAQLFAIGDTIYNDGNAANAPEFYFVVQGTLPGFVPPNSPTGRVSSFAGHVG